MANICITNYVIEGEKKELDALYQTMKELQEMKEPAVENGFGPTWLGCLVKALGKAAIKREESQACLSSPEREQARPKVKNPDEVECRGEWMDLERQGDTLRVTFETAWTPCYEVINLLKEAYPSLRIFYKAEEPGCEVYLKNDAEGKYFPETETDGHPYELMTEEREQAQTRIIRGIKDGSIKVTIKPSESSE